MTVKSTNYQLIDIFKNLPNSIIITTHKNPDADAIGSLLALNSLIQFLNKSATIYCIDFDINNFTYLKDTDQITNTYKRSQYDLGIFLDCSNKNRVNSIQSFPAVKKILNIDHHQDNTNFGDINIVEKISSTGEIIYNLFKELNVPITLNIATNLYAAICFDTGNFKFSNTSGSTLRAAAHFLDIGVDATTICTTIFDNKSIHYFNDIKFGLKNLYISKKYPFILIHIPYRKKLSNESTIEFFRQLEKNELVVVSKETKKSKYKISFRSNKYINVANIAAHFNGGGHIRAAGADATGSHSNLINKLIKHCDEAFK